MKRIIVVSAVNLVEGGPLSVLRECLRYLSRDLADEYEIIALVNRKDLFAFENIKFIEFPDAKRSWINRVYYEYYYFRGLSKRLNPFLWLSMHDMTPNVEAERLAVYCHNASPFYELSFREAVIAPRFALFRLFYKYLYGINIKKNDFVVVQQDWLRRKFAALFKTRNVIVAYPNIPRDTYAIKHDRESEGNDMVTFFYPAFPRVFKNFELICKSALILLNSGMRNFKILLTISGRENSYARYIYNSYKHIDNIRFLGLQDSDAISELYNRSDCIIFPSKLETWGLPITEAKLLNKPILLADLEYSHETLGEYDKARFFDPGCPDQLADAMKAIITNTIAFDKTSAPVIPEPFTRSWKDLFGILLDQSKL